MKIIGLYFTVYTVCFSIFIAFNSSWRKIMPNNVLNWRNTEYNISWKKIYAKNPKNHSRVITRSICVCIYQHWTCCIARNTPCAKLNLNFEYNFSRYIASLALAIRHVHVPMPWLPGHTDYSLITWKIPERIKIPRSDSLESAMHWAHWKHK